MNYSTLTGKKLVAIYENQILGTVETLLLSPDWKKVVGLKAKDASGETLTVELRRVYAFGEQAIMLRNTSACQKAFLRPCEAFVQGASLLTLSGLSQGTLTDLSCNASGKEVVLLSNTQTQIAPAQIVCKDKEMILTSENTCKKHHHFKPRQKLFALNQEKEIMVKALQDAQNPITTEPNASVAEDDKLKFNIKSAVPSRIMSSNEYLIGKKVVTDIVGLRNEILLRKGQVINEKHITVIKQHGKLRDLMMLTE